MSGYRSRLTFLFSAGLVLAGLILARSAWIQLIGDAKLERLAKRQFRSKVLISPRRGLILDRNGEPLAINLDAQSLAANPNQIKNPRQLSQAVAKALGIPPRMLFQKFSEKRDFVWIKRHLSDENFLSLKKARIIDGAGDLSDGLWLVKESQRVYPHNEVGAALIGNVSIDSEGVEGVEFWKDEQLRGRVVSLDAIKDALGRPTFIDANVAKAIKDGENLQLSVDASLQYSVEQELQNAIERSHARAGEVIVMNAENGEILALANQPTSNPNLRSAPASLRRNRAVVDGLEPGSILKPLLLTSALMNGWKLSDKVHGGFGKFVVQGKTISEAEAKEKYGWMTLDQMIQFSSNVGSARLALSLGSDKFLSTLKSLGIGSKTGLGFPGEISGWLPSNPKTVSPLSLANMGFGQGIVVSPLQMIKAYGMIFNGGFQIQPTLFLGEGKKGARVLPQKISEQVIKALATVTTEEGTGKKARLDGFAVVGKTGTAQTVDPITKRYSSSRYISSFMGSAIGVEPKLVIFTMLDGPKGVYYASDTAAPLFREVLEAVANRFSLPMKVPSAEVRKLALARVNQEIADQIQTSQAMVAPSAGVIPPSLRAFKNASGAIEFELPSFVGLTVREALQSLEGKDFRVSLRGFGVIRVQDPPSGTRIKPGQMIKLELDEP